MANEVLEMEARLKNYISQELKVIEKDFQSLQTTLTNTTKKTKQAEDGVTSMAKSIRSLGAAIGVGFSIQQITSFAKESSRAYSESILAEQRLTSALGKRSDMLLELAKEMQRTTTYEDDAVIAGEAQLANYVKEERVIKQLMPLVADLATAKGMDLASASNLVGRALQKDTEEIGRLGIKIRGESGSIERLNSMVDSLTKSFQGQAVAIGQTDVGKITQLKNEIQNIQEEIGKELIPVQYGYYKLVLDTLQGWKDISNAIGLTGQEEKSNAQQVEIYNASIAHSKKRIDELTFANKALGESAFTKEMKASAIEENNAKIERITTSMKAAIKASQELQGLGKGDSGAKPIGDYLKNPGGAKDDGGAAEKEAERQKNAIIGMRDFEAQMGLYLETLDMENKQKEAERDIELYLNKIRLRDADFQDAKDKADKKSALDKREKQEKMDAAESIATGTVGTLRMVAQASRASGQTMKRIAQMEATVNTAVAASKANTATPWPPVNAGLMAIAIAQGIAQVAIIERQKFQYGGVVQGNSFSGDNVQASLNSGEAVLTREMQSNMMRMLSSPQRSGVNDNRNFTLQLSLAPGTPVDMRAADRIESLVPIIADALIKAEYEGRLESVKPLLKR
jgi:hypothetical protein